MNLMDSFVCATAVCRRCRFKLFLGLYVVFFLMGFDFKGLSKYLLQVLWGVFLVFVGLISV